MGYLFKLQNQFGFINNLWRGVFYSRLHPVHSFYIFTHIFSLLSCVLRSSLLGHFIACLRWIMHRKWRVFCIFMGLFSGFLLKLLFLLSGSKSGHPWSGRGSWFSLRFYQTFTTPQPTDNKGDVAEGDLIPRNQCNAEIFFTPNQLFIDNFYTQYWYW